MEQANHKLRSAIQPGDYIAALQGLLSRVGSHTGLLLALTAFLLNSIWIATVPPLYAPDEPAHLQTIMEVRNKLILPEIHYALNGPAGQVIGTPGDESVRAYAVSQGFPGPYELIPYESMQPPLYYLVCGLAALALPADPQMVLYLSRLISALCGAITVFLVWSAVRVFANGHTRWAILAAGAVAFLPQFCFNSATAANDSMANALSTLLFYVWFRGLREPGYDRFLLKAGAVLGLAVLAKLTAVALVPAMLLVVLFRARDTNAARTLAGYLKSATRLAAGASFATLAVCGWWLLRNVLVYGEPTGSSDALRFYAGRFTHLDLANPGAVDFFVHATWASIWGLFGWMDLWMPDGFYQQALYITLTLVGLSIAFGLRKVWRRLRGTDLSFPSHVWQSTIVMCAVVIMLGIGYLQFNLNIALQAQGRYFFTALLPLSMLFTGGLYALTSLPRLKAIALKYPAFASAFTYLPLLWLGLANLFAVYSYHTP